MLESKEVARCNTIGWPNPLCFDRRLPGRYSRGAAVAKLCRWPVSDVACLVACHQDVDRFVGDCGRERRRCGGWGPTRPLVNRAGPPGAPFAGIRFPRAQIDWEPGYRRRVCHIDLQHGQLQAPMAPGLGPPGLALVWRGRPT